MNHEIIDDGGPAFPIPDSHHANGQVQYGSNGMSLRDWLAQNASDADVEEMRYGDLDFPGCEKPQYSRQEARYRHADAMLEARKSKP